LEKEAAMTSRRWIGGLVASVLAGALPAAALAHDHGRNDDHRDARDDHRDDNRDRHDDNRDRHDDDRDRREDRREDRKDERADQREDARDRKDLRKADKDRQARMNVVPQQKKVDKAYPQQSPNAQQKNAYPQPQQDNAQQEKKDDRY
jgi:hypothetical protein